MEDESRGFRLDAPSKLTLRRNQDIHLKNRLLQSTTRNAFIWTWKTERQSVRSRLKDFADRSSHTIKGTRRLQNVWCFFVRRGACSTRTHADLRTSASYRKMAFSKNQSPLLELLSCHCYTLLLLLLVLLCVREGACDRRTESVLLGQTITLSCSGVNGNRSCDWLQSSDGASWQVIFQNGIRYNNPAPPDRYSVEFNGLGFDLTIANAEQYDDSLFRCNINLGDIEEDSELTVLVRPETPTIEANIQSPTENDVTTLTCLSSGGNPNPNFTWWRNGNIIAGPTPGSSAGKFKNSSDSLIRTLDWTDNGMAYSCDVDNGVGGTVSAAIVLDVTYAPRLNVGPYENYMVEEGSDVTLTCSVNANPSASASWSGPSVSDENREIIYLPEVEASSSGTYTCEATNDVDTSTTLLELDVQYAAKINFKQNGADVQDSIIRVPENTPLTVMCESDANPAVNSIRWTNGESDSLQFIRINRGDAGVYFCEARNRLTPSGGEAVDRVTTANVTIVVKYPPGVATMTVPDYVYEGDSTTLSCDLDTEGEPAARWNWTNPNGSIIASDSRTYRISVTEFSDDGDYVCTPYNDAGPGVQGIQTLNVNAIPRWVDTSLPSTMTLNITDERVVEIDCTARGRPKPQITWFKDGVEVEFDSELYRKTEEETAVDQYITEVMSQLIFSGDGRSQNSALRREDNGNFTCSASNGLSQRPVDQTMQLIVQFPPELSTNASRVAAEDGSVAVLHCQAWSAPSSTFAWFSESGQEVVSNGRFNIQTIQHSVPYIHDSLLRISDSSGDVHGSFTCEAANLMGFGNPVQVELTPPTEPDSPSEVMMENVTWESVLLSWTPGFDGGYRQNFVVRYLASGQPDKEVESETPSMNLSGLMPSTSYSILVVAENILGSSRESPVVQVFTQDFPISPPGIARYNVKTRILIIESTSSGYCTRIEIDQGRNGWELYTACAVPVGDSIQISGEWKVNNLRVSVCLERRHDVCSRVLVAVRLDDVPVETIIIVACVCGSIVLILAIILIVLCWRRHQAKKKYEKEARTHQLHSASTNGQDRLDGIENAGMDSPDGLSDTQPPVYTSATSQYPHTPNGAPYLEYNNSQGPAVGRGNGYLPNGQANWPGNGSLPSYNSSFLTEEQMNSKNTARDTSHQGDDDSQLPHEQSKDSNRTGSDSGMSTPDPQKPKKVIYEVIV